jgi:hypothetical protein
MKKRSWLREFYGKNEILCWMITIAVVCLCCVALVGYLYPNFFC